MNSKLYVCGTQSLKDELKKEGLTLTENVEETDCIVLGFDTELNFKKLHDVSFLLCTRPGIPYFATNPDYVCPTEFGSVPDCGSVADMLYNVSKRRPVFIGKPEPAIALLAIEKAGCKPEDAVLIGDRIYTDIACGVNAGITTVLVFSGETTREDWEKSEIKPTYTCQDIAEIYEMIR